MKNSKKTALAGIFTALCVVALFMGSIIQTLDLSSAAIGSLIVLMALIELGNGWAFGVYSASSILSLVLLPYKTPAVIFVCFAGFYPILKVSLNRIKPIVLSYTVKVLIFNTFLTALIFVAKKFFGLEEEYLNFGLIIYALCNITFIAFDIALERVAVFYISKIRPSFTRR